MTFVLRSSIIEAEGEPVLWDGGFADRGLSVVQDRCALAEG